MSFARNHLGLIAAVAVCCLGCQRVEPIVEYTVARPRPVASAKGASSAGPQVSQPAQMLGAIVLDDDTGWFFKLTGDPKLVGPQRGAFVDFVKGLKFAGGEPTWTLPEGWKQLPARDLRFATIEIPVQSDTSGDSPKQPLELTVTPLSQGEMSETQFVLSNVNRWRDQVGLPAITAADLKDHDSLESLTVGQRKVTLVDVTGTSAGGGMGGAPFAPFAGGSAGSAAGGAAGSSRPAAPSASEPIDEDLSYNKPGHWVPGQQNQFSKLAFEVNENSQKVEITVTELGLGAGDVTANVNRWRGQVKLPPLAEIPEADLIPIETLGTEGKLVVLVGPEGRDRQVLLGVIAPTSDRVWFVKLLGDHDLALKERTNFEAFAKSLRQK